MMCRTEIWNRMMINRTKREKRIEVFKTCWTNYLLMKRQMKSLSWSCSNQTKIQMWIDIQVRRHWAMTMRISTKARDALNIWMRNQSLLLRIVKKMRNLIEILIFNWVFVADDWLRSIRQSNDNQIFDCDREKNIDEQLTCIQSARLFEDWYVKRQRMMSFCLRTNHRLNDAINCYA